MTVKYQLGAQSATKEKDGIDGPAIATAEEQGIDAYRV
jgi:hypothetical protein